MTCFFMVFVRVRKVSVHHSRPAGVCRRADAQNGGESCGDPNSAFMTSGLASVSPPGNGRFHAQVVRFDAQELGSLVLMKFAKLRIVLNREDHGHGR